MKDNIESDVLNSTTYHQNVMKCMSDAFSVVGLSQEEMTDAHQSGLAAVMRNTINFDICKFFQTFNECHAKIDTPCDTQIDPQIKMMVDLFKTTEIKLGCGQPEAEKLIQIMTKCGGKAIIASGMTHEELEIIKVPVEGDINASDLIQPLGKNKTCKYFKSLLDCIKAESAGQYVNSSIQSILFQLKENYDKLNCRDTSS